jgi:hypothetical protein
MLPATNERSRHFLQEAFFTNASDALQVLLATFAAML